MAIVWEDFGAYSRVVSAALTVGGSHEGRSDEDGGAHLDGGVGSVGIMLCEVCSCWLAMRSRLY